MLAPFIFLDGRLLPSHIAVILQCTADGSEDALGSRTANIGRRRSSLAEQPGSMCPQAGLRLLLALGRRWLRPPLLACAAALAQLRGHLGELRLHATHLASKDSILDVLCLFSSDRIIGCEPAPCWAQHLSSGPEALGEAMVEPRLRQPAMGGRGVAASTLGRRPEAPSLSVLLPCSRTAPPRPDSGPSWSRCAAR